MKEKKDVYKPPAVIHHNNSSVSLLQKKAWSFLIANAYDELPTEEIHQIGVRDLIRIMEYNSGDQAYLKDALRGLMTTLVEWDILRHDKKNVWQAATMLAEVRIEDGTCFYAFGPMFRQALYHPEIYARLSLHIIKQFSKKYALTLWEMCQHAMNPKTGVGETKWMLLDEFRKLMGVKDGTYKQFRDLNKWVIQPAIKEIGLLAYCDITPVYKRKGRKITDIKFQVARIQAIEAKAGLAIEARENDGVHEVVSASIEAGLSPSVAMQFWKKGFDVVHPESRPSGRDFAAYVRDKIALMNAQPAKKLGNKAGWLRRAIEENWTDEKVGKREQTQESQAQREQITHLTQEKEELEKGHADMCEDMFEHIAEENPHVVSDVLQEVFEEKPRLKTWYKSDKTPLDNYKRMMLKPFVNKKLRDKFPDIFTAIDQEYHQKIAAVNKKITALKSEN